VAPQHPLIFVTIIEIASLKNDLEPVAVRHTDLVEGMIDMRTVVSYAQVIPKVNRMRERISGLSLIAMVPWEVGSLRTSQ